MLLDGGFRCAVRPRHPSRRTAPVLIGLLVLVALAVAQLATQPGGPPPDNAPLPVQPDEAQVAPHAAAPPRAAVKMRRVVDGDTLLLADGTRVRLIGVDTPESVKPDTPVEPWGLEASAFTRAFVEGGDVRLEWDRGRQDRFGRALAYVWVGERMLNEELLRAGLARATLGYPFSEEKKARFRRAQEEARRARRGIWSEREKGGRRRAEKRRSNAGLHHAPHRPQKAG